MKAGFDGQPFKAACRVEAPTPHWRLPRLTGLLCILFASACQRNAAEPPPRYAIVRFENLSGDPSLEWLSRAASESLAVSLAGALDGPVLQPSALGRMVAVLGPRSAAAPGISTERDRALLANATRLISGYIERAHNEIRITATEEDLSNGKTLRIVHAQDASAMGALAGLARQLSAKAKPADTANPNALRLYATALESTVPVGIEDLQQATRQDPAFGDAWVSLANLEAARGDRAAAEEVIQRAQQQNLDPVSRARLNLEFANLQPDQAARLAAMRKLAAVSPGDTVLLRTLAESETTAGQFEAAAADWKRLNATLPSDASVWNSLGYSLSFAGDYNGALSALQEYARLRPKDANPEDSIGDLNYSFRKFKEAADSYLKAHNLQPDFERFSDLYKAAWAKFNAGDKTAADTLFSNFRAEREKTGDVLIPLIAADWLYRTGRQPEAFSFLRKTIAQTPAAPMRANAYAQLTIWELLEHNRSQAAQDSLSIGPKLTDAPMLIARFSALPSAPPEEWQMRAEKLIPPSMASLRPLALGYALLLDGKRDAALEVWAQIVKTTPATDFFARAVYARLQGKPLDRPLVPDSTNFNEFMAVMETL